MEIALLDGFNGQTVAIAVDGREVYRRSDVRTDLTISRADGFKVDAGVGPVQVTVAVDPGGLRATVQVDPAKTPFVAVEIKAGAITLSPSDQPFRYM